jgi:transcriptional regulator with XRE-family HTH domain
MPGWALTSAGPVGLPRLRQLRQRRLLTIAELAKLSGVHQNTISRIENGAEGIHPGTIRKLAATLEVAPSALMGPER